MSIAFKPLWKLLIDRDTTKDDLPSSSAGLPPQLPRWAKTATSPQRYLPKCVRN